VTDYMERNGWKLLRHPAFDEIHGALMAEVERLKIEHPENWQSHPKAKLLTRINSLIFDEIPDNPNAAEYQQGNTLGTENRHWRRAKFLQRFRLFFRFDSKSQIIIYGWVNDEKTLRKAGAKSDPYAVFEKRLKQGYPPSDWSTLLKQSTVEAQE
jgi:toxin YhaV